ncbi:MAG: hypothetical protein ACJ8AT_39965 [Hyalangium sp.]|uniref:hypothetical protein n=1 Tax=Hyalangium sp. TaxID=2028555 RepID=UPI00389A83A8
MSNLGRVLPAALVLTTLMIGCNVDPAGEETMSAPTEESGVTQQSVCTANATCSDGRQLSCQGNTTCISVDGSSGYVKCDGNGIYCAPQPSGCVWHNAYYPNGYVIGGGPGQGVYCSAKTNGYCIGGVYAGTSCVGSGDCYATCVNGSWEHI